ncbi:MAG TPA: serine hydrolase domain-containing protein [Anaerolineales bacterium]|nr:serine hydrolase domain-containing protein [Anaerolineales bacterium]
MAVSTSSQVAERIASEMSPRIERLMREKHITGLSAALVDEGDVLFSQGYGFANQEAKQPATSRTIYKIGSITKLFTGTAAMQLCERGLLDLDRPVSSYVPEFSARASAADLLKITPRTLMTHHSGLPSDWYAGYWEEDPHAFRRVIDYLHECPLCFPPNTVFSYSNLATSLMGVIIERVSSTTYQDYVEQNILAPLGMSSSALSAARAGDLFSRAYVRGVQAEDPTLRDAPAGAILSCVEDMARFAGMILGQGAYHGTRILQARTVAEMLSPQNAGVPLDLGFHIGLNWMLSRPALESAGRVCWHDGGSPHFFSILVALPDAGLAAIVLSNSDGGMVNVGLIADDMLKIALDLRSVKQPALVPQQATPEAVGGEESPEGRFAGTTGIVQIYRQREKLRMKMQGQNLLLDPVGDGWYALQLLLFGLLPVKVPSIAALRLTVRRMNNKRVLGVEQYGFRAAFGSEYVPARIPAAWSNAVGRYQLVTEDRLPPFTLLHLGIENGILMLRTTARKIGKISMVLQPRSETEAVVAGFGRTGGLVVELQSKGPDRTLMLLGLEFRQPQRR